MKPLHTIVPCAVWKLTKAPCCRRLMLASARSMRAAFEITVIGRADDKKRLNVDLHEHADKNRKSNFKCAGARVQNCKMITPQIHCDLHALAYLNICE